MAADAETPNADPAAGAGPPADAAPPVGRSWGRLYAVVIAWLAAVVVFLALLSWAYR
jgi:hypothetical protein